MNRSRPLSSPAVVRLACAISAVLCLLGVATTAQAQTTALFLDSQPGDYIGSGMQRLYTPADGTFQVIPSWYGSRAVQITVTAGVSLSWRVEFAAPEGTSLHVGEYGFATRFPFARFAAMDISGQSRGCNELTGRFLVRELVYDGNGAVERFAADFEQHCEDFDPGLFGVIRYNSTVSTLVPFDGIYPSYTLTTQLNEHGSVTGGGLGCGTTGGICSAPYAAPMVVTLTATPDPGYSFEGWTGGCHGGATMSVHINMVRQCSARFRQIGDGQPTTVLMWNSHQDDYIGQGKREVYSAVNSLWAVTTTDGGNGVSLRVDSLGDRSESDWYLNFSAPSGQLLSPGVYDGAARFPSASEPSVNVYGSGRGCNTIAGSFIVLDLAITAGTVTRLALDFEQHCGGIVIPGRPLRGSIRYNSLVPPRPSLTVTTVGSGAQVTLSPSGTVCVGRCVATFDLGTSVQLTPTPQAGWTLSGWSGDADCADGVVTMIAPIACTATFTAATVSAVSVSPSFGAGATQLFSLQYSDSVGATDIGTVWAWFNASFAASSANSCLLYYQRSTSTLYLLNDFQTWMAGALGSGGTLQNSQCAVNLSASSVATAGNTLTLNLAMTFKPAYAGTKNIYMYAASTGGASSGWQTRGSWNVPSGPAAVVTADSVTPNAGSGATQIFHALYSDTLGTGDLNTLWVWFTAAFGNSAANSCLLRYDVRTGTVYLLNDGSTWMPGGFGTDVTLQNSQCAVSLVNSSATQNGNSFALHLAMTFKGAYAGAKTVYMYGDSVSNVNSGWQSRGTWTVPAGSNPSVTPESVTPSSGSGSTQTFALRYSAAFGVMDLTKVWVWFTGSFGNSAANSCLLYYDRAAATLFLLNDSGTTWMPATLGSGAILQNAQCSVGLAGSSVVFGTTDLTLNLAMTFKSSFAGAKSIYMYAQSAVVNSGWLTRGGWVVPVSGPAVTADRATAVFGPGAMQTFALEYSHSSGAANVTEAWVWFTPLFSNSAQSSCLISYNSGTNALRLLDDGGTTWQSTLLGSVGVMQNSQCAISMGSTTATVAGNTLTLNVPVTFQGSYLGTTPSIFMYAADISQNSGWQLRGTYAIP